MTREEFQILRDEACGFLDAVQDLPGFSEERTKLAPPALALTFPMRSLRRILTLPDAIPGAPPPGTGVLYDGMKEGFIGPRILLERPRPEPEDLDVLDAYVGRVSRFAAQFLLRTQWGARAMHEALCNETRITLPMPAPDRHVRIGTPHSKGWIPEGEIEEALRQLAPIKELGSRGRTKTWAQAIAGVEARLAGKPAPSRSAVARARRFLDAAVNRKLAGPRDPIDPLEPSDDPTYETKVNQRLRRRADST